MKSETLTAINQLTNVAVAAVILLAVEQLALSCLFSMAG